MGILETIRVDVSASKSSAKRLLRALSNDERLEILCYLGDQDGAVALAQIARDLELAPSSAAAHVVVLEEAGLVQSKLEPAKRGLQKVCWRICDTINIELPRGDDERPPSYDVSLAFGSFTEASVEPRCGLAGATGLIGIVDDPQTFLDPDRHEAQMLWFAAGHLEYRLPNRVPRGARIDALELTAEVGTLGSGGHPGQPSEISVWVDGVHLGAWTSPGEPGDAPSRQTPSWWPEGAARLGMLKRWRVTADGTAIDGERLSAVSLEDLALEAGQPFRVRIGIAPDAVHVGGVTLFGRGFGNHPQDLGVRLEYTPRARGDGG